MHGYYTKRRIFFAEVEPILQTGHAVQELPKVDNLYQSRRDGTIVEFTHMCLQIRYHNSNLPPD